MTVRWLLPLLFSSAVVTACSSSNDGTMQTTEPVYARIGKAKGVDAVVTDFLERVTADPKINGYFLNSTLDTAHLKDCLVKQIGSATGGPEKYECRNMKDAHAGLGISKQDFDDLVGHLTEALKAAKVEQKDIDTILGVLGPMEVEIVEDSTNDADIYQRVGRKPAIQAVVADFHGRVMQDTRIVSFFDGVNTDRLATCLVRQVCQATGGPCKYGEEIPNAEPGVVSACRSMKEAHAGLNIAKTDFDILVEHLVAAIDAAGVSMEDRDAIVGVLAPMCTDVVENGTCN
jgi:truncated hemoglobin YjbI